MPEPHSLFQTAMTEDPAAQNKAIIEHLVSLSESLGQIRNDLAGARDELHSRADATERHVQELRHAFPADDPAGHRAYHDEVIAIARARKEFWQKLLFELAKWGLLGFVAWLVLAGWRDFLKGPN